MSCGTACGLAQYAWCSQVRLAKDKEEQLKDCSMCRRRLPCHMARAKDNAFGVDRRNLYSGFCNAYKVCMKERRKK